MHCPNSITDTLDTVKIAKGILENLSRVGVCAWLSGRQAPPLPPLPTFQNAPMLLLFFAMSNETFNREISGRHHIIFQEQQIKFNDISQKYDHKFQPINLIKE